MAINILLRSIKCSFLILMLALPGYSHAAPSEAANGTVTGGKVSEHPDWFKDSFLDIADDVEEAT